MSLFLFPLFFSFSFLSFPFLPSFFWRRRGGPGPAGPPWIRAWGAWGICSPPPVRGSAPTCPPSEEKMGKISHFRQIFGFLPPQNHILPPRCPHKKKKKKKFWCRHCFKGTFLVANVRSVIV